MPGGTVRPACPDPTGLAHRAEAGVAAVFTEWLAGPLGGPAAGALAALSGRAPVPAGSGPAVAVVGSVAELTDPARPWALPWSPTLDGTVGALLALAPDAVAVVEGGDLRCVPADAGAFEELAGVTVTLAPGARPTVRSLPPDVAFAARAAARLCGAALLVGVAQAALDDVTAYGSTRIVFGQPVLGHQANAFDLAGAATRVEAARRALARAAERADPRVFGWAASQAYLEARVAALAATDLGVQLHGGHGYLQGRLTERFFREARMLSLLWGGADAAIDDLAERALEAPEWTWP